ncbi:MAG: hypothetical protein J5562_03200 [Clostridia bacterium]|nr:hypothetical protein [Clostridia bacterium]
MALTYSECKKIALEKNPKLNACYEYENAYRYFEKTDVETDGDFEVVVLKETGRTMGRVQYMIDFSPPTDSKEIGF